MLKGQKIAAFGSSYRGSVRPKKIATCGTPCRSCRRLRSFRGYELITDCQNARLVSPDKHIEITDFVLFQLSLLSQR